MSCIKRRTLLAAGAVGAVAGTVGLPSTARAASTLERHLAVVGHPDDDLLFMNPDIQQGIARGRATRTVFLTAGEYNGTDTLTREAYAADLQRGMHAAYALLAGVADDWTRTAVTIAGKQVELHTLRPAPHVELLFVNIPDGFDDRYDHPMTNLWSRPGFATDTLVPTGGPITAVQRYDHNSLAAMLTELMRQFAPTVIRLQDADSRLHLFARNTSGGLSATAQTSPGGRFGAWSDLGGGPDVQDSMSAFLGPDGQIDVFADGRGNTLRWRAAAVGFALDSAFPRIECVGAPAVARNADGRIQIFNREHSDGALGTACELPGGGWSPQIAHLGGTGWTTPVAVTTPMPDSRMVVFARNDSGGVITARQSEKDGGLFTPWTDLGGTVESGLSAHLDATGRIRLLAQSGDGGVWERAQANPGADSPFAPWQRLP